MASKGVPLAEIEARFLKETGRPISAVGAVLAMEEVRRLHGIVENPRYTTEQIAQWERWEAMRNPSSKYLFHATSPDRLLSIAQHGLVPGSPARHEGVGHGDAVYLAANAEHAAYYVDGNACVLRIAKRYEFDDLAPDLLGGEGAYMSKTPVPPEALELRQGRRWVPLCDVFEAELLSMKNPQLSPAFTRWFSGSQVCSEDGKPAVFYHGTLVHDLPNHQLGDIHAFDRMITTRFRRQSMDTVGSWFSNNPGTGGSGMYSDGEAGVTYPVYLAIKNPKVYERFSDFIEEMHIAAGRDPKKQNPIGIGSTEELREKLMAEGFDGIKFIQTSFSAKRDAIQMEIDAIKAEQSAHNEEVKLRFDSCTKSERALFRERDREIYERLKDAQERFNEVPNSTEFDHQEVLIAFEPEQIKSAIGNSGAFDPYSPFLADAHPSLRWHAEQLAYAERDAGRPDGLALEVYLEAAAQDYPPNDPYWGELAQVLIDALPADLRPERQAIEQVIDGDAVMGMEQVRDDAIYRP